MNNEVIILYSSNSIATLRCLTPQLSLQGHINCRNIKMAYKYAFRRWTIGELLPLILYNENIKIQGGHISARKPVFPKPLWLD